MWAAFRVSCVAMQPTLNIATRAARAAGRILLRYFERVDQVNIQVKSHNDFVSEVDRAARGHAGTGIDRSLLTLQNSWAGTPWLAIRHFIDPKYRSVSCLMTLDKSRRAMRLGMAMRPFARSEKFQTNSNFIMAPTITAETKISR